MQSTGRTPVLTQEEYELELGKRQESKDNKRETRKSLMKVVAKATDVLVKRAPVAKRGELPHTRWEYHERIVTPRRIEE